MTIRTTILRLVAGLMFERPARKQSLPEIIVSLEKSGAALQQNFAAVPDKPENRELLRHIIGIERWGQRRLRVALGAEPVRDEYDGYCPAEGLDMATLRGELQSTRRETVAIAHAFESGLNRLDTIVFHNDFGDLSVRGWLRYLEGHANIEAKRAKK